MSVVEGMTEVGRGGGGGGGGAGVCRRNDPCGRHSQQESPGCMQLGLHCLIFRSNRFPSSLMGSFLCEVGDRGVQCMSSGSHQVSSSRCKSIRRIREVGPRLGGWAVTGAVAWQLS